MVEEGDRIGLSQRERDRLRLLQDVHAGEGGGVPEAERASGAAVAGGIGAQRPFGPGAWFAWSTVDSAFVRAAEEEGVAGVSSSVRGFRPDLGQREVGGGRAGGGCRHAAAVVVGRGTVAASSAAGATPLWRGGYPFNSYLGRVKRVNRGNAVSWVRVVGDSFLAPGRRVRQGANRVIGGMSGGAAGAHGEGGSLLGEEMAGFFPPRLKVGRGG